MITRAEFFEELLRGTTGQLELRRMKWNPRKHDKGAYDMLERWFSRDIAELEAFASNGGGDIFHGVNIRDDSGEARKKNIREIVCAEVDIDFKTTTQEQADELLAISIFEPTVFIGSGNGYHAYWLFDTPIPATEETINLIEAINKGLAQQFGDDYTHDVTRILRTPGRKNSKYNDNRRCEILRTDGPRYSIDDLEPFAVVSNSTGPKADIGDDCEGELPKRFEKLLAKHRLIGKTWRGERPELKDQSRSGYDMAMADLLAAHKFIPAAAAAILRRMPSGKGADASDSYLRHTISKAFTAPESGESEELAKEHHFTLISAHDVLAAEDVEQSWTWDGILPDGGMSLLVAKPKVGKTTLAFNLAVAVSRGADFLNRKTEQGPGVYLALEEKKGEIKKKLTAAGITNEPLRFHFGSAPLNAMAEVEPLLVETKAKLLVIDVLQKFCRLRDLNDYAIVTNALEPLMAAARKQGCHILLTHHAGKADRADGDDILGSTGLLGGVDTSIHIKKRDKRRTFFTIQRYGDDTEETVIELNEDGSLEAKGTRQDVEVDETLRPLLDALKNTGPMTLTELHEAVEKSRNVVLKAANLLAEKHLIEKSGSGKKNDPYKYSVLLYSDTNEYTNTESKIIPNPAESKKESCTDDFDVFSLTDGSSGEAF